jgi:hypothetical protein
MHVKEISLKLDKSEVISGELVRGKIHIGYTGRFDSIVINSQIENTSDIFSFVEIDEKKTNYQYARISILKSELKNSNIEFTVTTNHIPASPSVKAKFRVSVIQEHKEIASDVAYVKVIKY